MPFSSIAFPARIDSVMLVEEGFQVVSVDASDKMLKYALKERLNRCSKSPNFDNWSNISSLCIFHMQQYISIKQRDGEREREMKCSYPFGFNYIVVFLCTAIEEANWPNIVR